MKPLFRVDKKVEKRRPFRKIIIGTFFILVMAIAGAVYWYKSNLVALSSTSEDKVNVIVETGMTEAQVAKDLESKGLIKSALVYEIYNRLNNKSGKMQVGTYEITASMSVADIVEKITNGDVVVELVTILPAQRLDQLKDFFLGKGYSQKEIDDAFNPAKYINHPALTSKPPLANLEGYLYPESFLMTANTPLETIITASLDQMNLALTDELKTAYKNAGLTVNEAVVLASIIEKEVSSQEDREKAAQVFLSRYNIGMALGSDVTAYYGAIINGLELTVSADSQYNTRLYTGLPPGPINNVSASSLRAVAYPSKTDYLYFVAGDDGITYFSKTLSEHEALTAEHCIELCKIP